MCAKERGLGRGLDTLFRNADETAPEKGATKLPLASIKPNAEQPRTHFDEQALGELADSIRTQGVIQPILVRPLSAAASSNALPQQYEIVAGERRWRAARLAGLTEVPVIIRSLSDQEVLAIALIENIQREDLNAVEEAQAIERLRVTFQIGQEELAKRLGKSRSAIANALRLLQLPQIILDSLSAAQITAGHARCLLAISDSAVQSTLHSAIITHELSVRDAEAAVTHWKTQHCLPETIAETPLQKTPEPSSPSRASTRVKAPVIMTLQGHLRSLIHPRTTLNGTMEMGRITLPYESSEQLATLLTRLGVRSEDIAPPEDAGKAGNGDTKGRA